VQYNGGTEYPKGWDNMSIVFATCNLNMAIGFIDKMYPDRADITASDIQLLSKLIKEDVLRVQDPDFHRPCQIVGDNKYDEATHSKDIEKALKEFKQVIDTVRGS